MLRKLIAFLTGGKVVWLKDHDGELTRTIAYPAGFGTWSAHRMLGDKVTLHPDGTVTGKSYVKYWEFEDQKNAGKYGK